MGEFSDGKLHRGGWHGSRTAHTGTMGRCNRTMATTRENAPTGKGTGLGGVTSACPQWWGGGRICFCSAIGRRAVMAVSSVINVQANPKIQEFGPGRFGEGQLSGPGRGAGANSGLPGCGHQATRGRSRRELHGSSSHSEHWGGANFSLLFTPNRVGGSGATRESPSRPALLPAGPLRTGGAHQGAGPLLNLDGVGGSRTAPTGDGQRNGIRAPTRSLFQK